VEQGFYPGVSHEAYHADCAPISLSASIAHKLVSQSPLHAWHAHPRLGGAEREPPTREMDEGALVHALMLGAGPEIVPVDADDWRTKAAKEAREAARDAGKLPVLAAKLETARKLSEQLLARLADRGVVFSGMSELTAVWREGDTKCRGRLDHWREDIATIYDLKFYSSAQPEAFARQMIAHGLDIQRAAYVSAAEKIRPDLAGRVRFLNVVIESSEPHPITLVEARGSMREMGERKWRRAVELWERCLSSGKWPAYADDIVPVEAPAWAIAADMEKQLTELGDSNVGF